MIETGREIQAARPVFGWNRDGSRYALEISAETFASLRWGWAGRDDEVVLPLPGGLTVRRHRGAGQVTDTESGRPLAQIRSGRRSPAGRRSLVVRFSSGREVRWVSPSSLVWQCGFVAVAGPGAAAGTNVVLFAVDGTAIVTHPRSPALRAAGAGPWLTEAELLVALGWLFLLTGDGGRRTTAMLAALERRTSGAGQVDGVRNVDAGVNNGAERRRPPRHIEVPPTRSPATDGGIPTAGKPAVGIPAAGTQGSAPEAASEPKTATEPVSAPTS